MTDHFQLLICTLFQCPYSTDLLAFLCSCVKGDTTMKNTFLIFLTFSVLKKNR